MEVAYTYKLKDSQHQKLLLSADDDFTTASWLELVLLRAILT